MPPVGSAGLPSVREGPFAGFQRRVHLCAYARHLGERGVGDVQRQVVAGGLELGQGPLDGCGQLLRRALRLEVEPEHTRHDPPGDLADTIARRSGPLGEEICSPERVVGPACPEQGLAELGLEGEVDLVRRQERGGALEQAHGGAVVLPTRRTVAAGRQAPSRRGGQGAVVGRPEIGAVATGDLEVVAEELVQLDEFGPVLLQPGREALVEACPGGFRERVVGRVADEDVAEAEAVLAREQRRVRRDQLLANERGETRRHLRLLGCERLDGTAVEDLTLDRAPLEHAPLGRRELVDTRREQRLQRGRHDHLAVRFASHRQHLLDEERVAARGASDRVTQLADDPLPG